jgi:hypothetical protein
MELSHGEKKKKMTETLHRCSTRHDAVSRHFWGWGGDTPSPNKKIYSFLKLHAGILNFDHFEICDHDDRRIINALQCFKN